MKILLLSILASFIVSFVTVQALQTQTEEASDFSIAPEPTHWAVDMQDTLASLVEENRALAARLAFVENQPLSQMRLPVDTDWVPRSEFLALQDEFRAITKAISNPSAPNVDLAHPRFRGQLETALGDIRKGEMVNRAKTSQEKRAAALEPALATMQTQLGLNQSQVSEMRTALESKMVRDADLTQRWEQGEDNQALGQLKRDNRTTHQAELQRILTPSQLEQLRAQRGGK